MKTVMNTEKQQVNKNQEVVQEVIEELTEELTQEVVKPKVNMVFTPRRFSVNGLRRHRGIQTSRTPRVAF